MGQWVNGSMSQWVHEINRQPLTINRLRAIIPCVSEKGGVNVKKQTKPKPTKRKPTKRNDGIKLKGVISKGEHLSIEERMAAAKEFIGGLKRLGFKEEDFAEFFEGERDEEIKEESRPAGGN
jgi:hypothetical protein